jgi:hypothetical protein
LTTGLRSSPPQHEIAIEIELELEIEIELELEIEIELELEIEIELEIGIGNDIEIEIEFASRHYPSQNWNFRRNRPSCCIVRFQPAPSAFSKRTCTSLTPHLHLSCAKS